MMVFYMQIYAQRLKELRTQQGLSREQLEEQANVSARQIARIESSAELATVRRKTADGLAKALGVTIEMLVGEEQPGAKSQMDRARSEASDRRTARHGTGKNGATHVEVHADILKYARRWRGLSRRELAGESGVSERQIARMESSDTPTRVRRATAERLARVLYIETQSFGETLDLPEDLLFAPVHALKHATPQVQLGARVSHQVRFAYDLVRDRYGASVRDIVVLAPLLFVLLAEGSLAWRREKLDAVREAMEYLRSFADSQQHLYFTKYITDAQDGYIGEKMSLNASDVTGEMLREDDFVRDFEFGDVYPFQGYLEMLVASLERADVADFNPGDRITPDPYWGISPYRLCPGRLETLTGGSNHARWALEYGDVRLTEIPKELMVDAAAAERVKWLESRLSDEVRNSMEASETLMDLLMRKHPDKDAAGDRK